MAHIYRIKARVANQRSHSKRAATSFARRNGRSFVYGCLAACGVVTGRLALPWPFQAITDQWVSDPPAGDGLIAGLIPDAADYVLAMAVMGDVPVDVEKLR